MLKPIPKQLLQHLAVIHLCTGVDGWQAPKWENIEVRGVHIQPTNSIVKTATNIEVVLRSILFVDSIRSIPHERYYYGLFALNQRLPGIFANISGTATLGSITFTTSAGADSTHTIIKGLGPAPYGMAYVAKSGDAAALPTYGDKLTTGWTPVANGASLTSASGKVITVALVNTTKGNIAVAGGSATAVVGA